MKNIRSSITNLDDAALRASLKVFGWLKALPAIIDQDGETLVGHRRLRLAKQIDIEPVTRTVHCKNDEERLQIQIASNVGFEPMSKEDRIKVAKQMATDDPNLTQQEIADVLGVTQSAISKDLRDLFHGINQKRAKTARNPKGSGRKKATPEEKAAKAAAAAAKKAAAKKAAEDRKQEEKESKAEAEPTKEKDDKGRLGAIDIKPDDPEDWKKFKIAAIKAKKSPTKLANELMAAYVNPTVKIEDLAMSAQEKLEAAMRQRQKVLDQDFERRVQDEVKRRVDDLVLPHWKQKIEEAHKLYARRKGVMDKATYTKIRACLHTDRLAQLMDIPSAKLDANLAKRYNEAFNLFESLEKYLLDEKDSPSHIGDLPANLDEWDRVKREVAAARKAGRTAVRRR